MMETSPRAASRRCRSPIIVRHQHAAGVWDEQLRGSAGANSLPDPKNLTPRRGCQMRSSRFCGEVAYVCLIEQRSDGCQVAAWKTAFGSRCHRQEIRAGDKGGVDALCERCKEHPEASFCPSTNHRILTHTAPAVDQSVEKHSINIGRRHSFCTLRARSKT